MLYTDIAKKLVKTDESLKRIAAEKGKEAIISYVLDATGLGSPTCELVEKASPLADIKRVFITGGINTTEGSGTMNITFPRVNSFRDWLQHLISGASI